MMVFIRSSFGSEMLLRPQRPSTAVDERERPTWRASPRFFYIRRGAERRRRQRRDLVSTGLGIAAVMTLTARRREPPQRLPRGRGRLFVFGKFRGDFEPWARLAFVLVEEGGQAEHVQREASGVSAGGDQTMRLI